MESPTSFLHFGHLGIKFPYETFDSVNLLSFTTSLRPSIIDYFPQVKAPTATTFKIIKFTRCYIPSPFNYVLDVFILFQLVFPGHNKFRFKLLHKKEKNKEIVGRLWGNDTISLDDRLNSLRPFLNCPNLVKLK